MKTLLTKKGWNQNDIIQDGNSFLVANGHLGYRGTLEEYGADQLVGLNLGGVYDRSGNQWREPIVMPNPFLLLVEADGKPIQVFKEKARHHEISLTDDGVFHRRTEFKDIMIESERTASHADDRLVLERFRLIAKKRLAITVLMGMDPEIAELAGPHFKSAEYSIQDNRIRFAGETNEGKKLFESAVYECAENLESVGKNRLKLSKIVEKGEILTISVTSLISETEPFDPVANRFEESLQASRLAFEKKLAAADIGLRGDAAAEADLRYSIYQSLILGDRERTRGISGRGLSGQTYKGAVFWDTEIFLLPFFTLVDPRVARNLILYRVKTLPGAMAKAKGLGYKGAFYAWESQDDGSEQCSKYNVTDPETGEPVRTYFGEKQIHISADIPYAIEKYIEQTGDKSILDEGAREVIEECARFFMSRAELGEDGLYHLNDVIGPDEYHEGVDDNAFTAYMAEETLRFALNRTNDEDLRQEIARYLDHWYLPKPNADGVIEQFKGYFAKKDSTIEELRSSLHHPNEYWGGENGVATPTKIIKQADVIALMALLPHRFSKETQMANYEYYAPQTEHGSSLSDSMYAIVGARIGKTKEAYEHFRKTASIDIRGASKQFAGGVYIGGTHPAANAGTVLAVTQGFLGLQMHGGEITVDPKFPKQIKSIRLRYVAGNSIKEATIDRDGIKTIKEVAHD